MDAVVLYPEVGTKEDVASATGSLHAKIAELRAYIDTELAKVQKPRGVANVAGSFFTDQTTYQTALNISGKGKLLMLGVYRMAESRMAVKVTIDGKVVGLGDGQISLSVTPSGWIFPAPNFVLDPNESGGVSDYMRLTPMVRVINGTASPWIGSPRLDLSFKSSLKIEQKRIYDAAAYVYWQYEIEE